MNWTIYHNPRCSKSRETLELLEKNAIRPEVVEYLKTPLTRGQILDLMEKISFPVGGLVRTKEDLFQAAPFSLEDKDQVAAALEAHPELLERPIVVKGNRAVLGRPPENIFTLFDS